MTINYGKQISNGLQTLRLASVAAIVTILLPFLASVALATGGQPTDLNKAAEVLDVEALFPSEEGLVQVEVSGIDNHDFLARYMGDSLFIPYIGICDFLRLQNSVSPDLMTLSGEIGKKGAFTISRQSSSVTYASAESFTFPMTAIRIVRGEVYIEHSLLSKVLGVTMLFDVSNLKLMINADERLPIVQWSRNQSRYQSLMFDQKEGHDVDVAEISRSFFSAPIINWSLSSNFDKISARSIGAQIRFGGQLMFGAIEGGLIGGYSSGKATYSFDAFSWRYQMPASSLLRQITLGTILLDGSRQTGVELSNVPFTQRRNARTYELTGTTQPNWTVELYDADRLIDVTQADSTGRYSFQMAMNYGTVDRVIRQLGPRGEVFVEPRRVQISQQMLPSGVVEYTAAAGVDSLRLSSAINGRGRVMVGLNDRVTVGAELGFRGPLTAAPSIDSVSPKALASLWLGQSMSLGLRYDIRAARAAADFYMTDAGNSSYHLTVDSLSIAEGTFNAIGSVGQTYGRVTVGATAGVSRMTNGTAFGIEPQISTYLNGYSLVAGARYATTSLGTSEGTANNSSLSSSLRVIGTPLPGLLVSAQGTYDFIEHTVSSLAVSTYVRMNNLFGVNVGYEVRNLDFRSGTVQAQMNLDLASFRAAVTSNYQGGSLMTSSYLQGSAILSGHGVMAFAEPSVGQSSIILEAFADENGNGIRDNGEELIAAPPARMSLDGTDRTTEDGLFRSIPANHECTIEVDRWMHANNNLFPGRARFSLYTLPNEFQVIEIPYSEGFDVSGTCTTMDVDGSRERSNRGVTEGLRVRLVSKSGQSFDGEVFVDGSLLVTGVTAGEYTIEFDQAQLESRRLRQNDAAMTVTLGVENHRIPTIVLDVVSGR